MTVATKILMGSGAVAEPYEIEQSLIFDDASGLVRTPSSASNRKTWTWSGWVKRSETNGSDIFSLFSADGSSDNSYIVFYLDDLYILDYDYDGGGSKWFLITNRVFRDFSAWYHIVFAVDTTQSTASNRLKLYVNGVQETSFSTETYPAQNYDGFVNSTYQHHVGTAFTSASTYNLDGQLAEVHFIDGTALAASSFGETNEDTGQWIPKKYGGSYGTNGFYFKFASGAIGTDSSGEGNNYTASNLANSDVVIDSPTNNFATLNPLPSLSSALVLSEGNLKGAFRGTGVANGFNAVSTLAMPVGSGKWYFEMRNTYQGNGFILGIQPKSENYGLVYPNSLGYYYATNGTKAYNGYANETSYGTAWFTSGQTYIISCYYDSDLGKIGFYMNGADQGFAFTNVNSVAQLAAFSNGSGGSNTFPTIINFGQNGTFNGAVTAQGNADANGIGDFYYAPPSGYKALCTANLPDPAIPLPSAQFNPVVWAGNATDNRAIAAGFAPDLTWFKQRTGTNSLALFDTVRGNSNPNGLSSNSNSQEFDWTGIFKGHTSTGFTVGTDTAVNANSNTYVSWNWKANGSGSTDTSGDIDAVVSANQAAGFSIITWTGDGGGHTTVPHGLGVAPEIIFEKYRNAAGNWYTWLTVIDGTNDFLRLDLNSAAGDAGASGTPTSQFFSNWGSPSGRTNVAYAFVSKPGFSKIGVYTGNGSATAGPFVNLGFKPAWLMVKRTDATAYWTIFDNARSPFNEVNKELYANVNNAESTSYKVDFLSNGFKFRNAGNDVNTSGGVYLFMAFADSPFRTSNAH